MVGRMALVQVGPTTERNARNAIQQTGSKHAGMPLHAYGRESRDITERNLVSALEAVRQASKPRSEDQADGRPETAGESIDLSGGLLRGGSTQDNTPASDAVIQVATVPPSIARMPSLDRSCLRSGAIPPIPPI